MQAIANFLTGPLFQILRPLGALVGKLFNPVVGVFLVLYQTVAFITKELLGLEFYFTNLEFLYQAVNEYTFQSLFSGFPEAMTELIAFANYIFPVTETMLMLGALSAVYSLCVVVRIAKACIPAAYGS